MSICVERLQERVRAFQCGELSGGAFAEEVFRILGEARSERLSQGEHRYIHDLLRSLERKGLAPEEACEQARSLFPLSLVPTVDEFTGGGDPDDEDDEDDDGDWEEESGPSREQGKGSDSPAGFRWTRLLVAGLVLGIVLGLLAAGAVLLYPKLSQQREESRQMAMQQATALALEHLREVQQALVPEGRDQDIDAVATRLISGPDLKTDDGWLISFGADAFNGRIVLILSRDTDKEMVNLFLCNGSFRLEDCYEPL